MLRRDVLTGLLAALALPARAGDGDAAALSGGAAEPGLQLGAARPFDAEGLRESARALAETAHKAPKRIPAAWTDLSYDQYRAIWFDARNALWEGTEAPLRLDVFAPGLYFPTPIRLEVVEDGQTRPVLFDMNVFDKTDQFPDLPVDETLGYSGFRLRAELERQDIFTEFAVFQGASYFRGIGAGQTYGLSARGLSIDTAEPSGEEFPEFRHFWIERPAPEAGTVVVHALLDSPSCTGVYRFEIKPGDALEIGVEAEIFARRTMTHFGIGALTSMFQFDETNRDRFSDFRSAIHDSDGLLIENGGGETIWRPLANPKTLQISGFQDDNPKGFGLMQRARQFEDFADLQALYHKRPSLWIAPRAGWGRGEVTLVEIPTDDEVYDNIVAYWRPAAPLEPGHSRAFAYDMTWSDRAEYGTGLRVHNTRAGAARGGGIRFAIDFAHDDNMPRDPEDIAPLVRASDGTIVAPILEINPQTGGLRLGFTLDPGNATLVEMRAQLRQGGGPLSEVWLYRWTA